MKAAAHSDRSVFRVVVRGGPPFQGRIQGLVPQAPRLEFERREGASADEDGTLSANVIVVDAAVPPGRRAADSPCAPLVAVDVRGDLARAAAWFKAGAADYVALDQDSGALPRLIASLYEKWRKQASAPRPSPLADLDLIGTSSYVQELRQLVGKLARLKDLTVLIQGETGTGKGLLTRHIHARSEVAGELIEINCAAIPEQLLESELFGYEPGAFTGARQRKRGLLELAEGGTLMLDEIGSMPLDLQSKILKCIEEKHFRRIGGARELRVQTRIVACSNADLGGLAAQGKFRQDLYFRLNVFPVRLRPLRERPDDIPPLANYFLHEFAQLYRLPVTGISASAMAVLAAQPWPGNVRELKHAVERGVILREAGPLRPEDFGAAAAAVTAGPPPARFTVSLGPGGVKLEDAEREVIGQTLKLTGGNRSQAADILGIPRSRLLRKIARYRLQDTGRGDGAVSGPDRT